jgi:tRNA-Thr(GGU) m(6)t(6)A37 methyltransferase TsaA
MKKRRHGTMNSNGEAEDSKNNEEAGRNGAAVAVAAAPGPGATGPRGKKAVVRSAGAGSSAALAAAAVSDTALRALESLLLNAVCRAQHGGELPSLDSGCWASVLRVQPHTAVRASAATHYTAGVLKAIQTFNGKHHPTATRKQPKAKKQRLAATEIDTVDATAAAGAVPAVAVPADAAMQTEDDVSVSPSAAAAASAASDATLSAMSAAATGSSAVRLVADPLVWAEVIGRHATELLRALPDDHVLHERVKIDVPPPGSSPRPSGFIDFTIRQDQTAAAAGAAASAASSTLVSAVPPSVVSSSDDGSAESASSVPSFTFHSIGLISSVFKLRYGTPRQGTIAPSARGSLTLAPHIPAASLEGLEEYSHIWLVFVFHANANKRFAPKVEPPRAQGAKIGVFATRSPHRANPIGLSLVRLDRVDLAARTLHLSSLDLIEGTPILDIKPYHPADALPEGAYTLPQWMDEQAQQRPPMPVDFSDEALVQLADLLPPRSGKASKLQFYSDLPSARGAIEDSVRHDPRPRYVKSRAAPAEVYGFRLDRMNVLYRVDDVQRRVRVVAVQYVDYAALTREIEAEDAAAAAASAGGRTKPELDEEGAPLSLEERITKRFLQQRSKRSYEAEAQAEIAAAAAGAASGAAAANSGAASNSSAAAASLPPNESD